MLQKPLNYIVIAVIAILVIFQVYHRFDWKNFMHGNQQGEAAIGGAFELTNQRGQRVSNTDFDGKLMLVYFGFTHCPDICPTDLATLSNVLDSLGDASEAVQLVFITVDPERDTPEVMAEYVQNFHPSIQALTGTKEEIAAVANEYKVYHNAVPQTHEHADEHEDGDDDHAHMESEYNVDHSAFTYLMGTDGKYLTHFAHGTNPDEIVRKIGENL